jgi:transcriptional regulator of acetoin/glycerol metabolism
MHLPAELSGGSTLVGSALHSDDERSRIQSALERQHWHRNRTAADLGIDRTTLWRKIREYNLKQDD